MNLRAVVLGGVEGSIDLTLLRSVFKLHDFPHPPRNKQGAPPVCSADFSLNVAVPVTFSTGFLDLSLCKPLISSSTKYRQR